MDIDGPRGVPLRLECEVPKESWSLDLFGRRGKLWGEHCLGTVLCTPIRRRKQRGLCHALHQKKGVGRTKAGTAPCQGAE